MAFAHGSTDAQKSMGIITLALVAVRWGVATNILVAWVLTLPLSGALAWATMKGVDVLFG